MVYSGIGVLLGSSVDHASAIRRQTWIPRELRLTCENYCLNFRICSNKCGLLLSQPNCLQARQKTLLNGSGTGQRPTYGCLPLKWEPAALILGGTPPNLDPQLDFHVH
jgi:hypothetical protein